MAPERSVTLTISADDSVDAMKLHLLSRFKRPWFVAIAALSCIPLYVLVSDLLKSPVFEWWDLSSPLMIVVLQALPFFLYFIGIPLSARSTYKRQKSLHQPLTLKWSEDGLTATGQTGHWTIAWSEYHRFLGGPKTLLFYQGPNLFQILPTRALSQEQLDDLKHFAARISP